MKSRFKLLINFKKVFTEYIDKRNLLEVLKKQQQDANLTFGFNKFLFDELDSAGLKENELEDSASVSWLFAAR